MNNEIKNILFKIKNDACKAKEYELEEDEIFYIGFNLKKWNILLDYIKKLESDLKMERELRDNALKMYDELLQGGDKE